MLFRSYVGGAEIQIVEKKVEQFPFLNKTEATQGENKKVVHVDWKTVMIFILAIAALLGLLILVVYIMRNFYLLKYELNRRRKEKLKSVLKAKTTKKRRMARWFIGRR